MASNIAATVQGTGKEQSLPIGVHPPDRRTIPPVLRRATQEDYWVHLTKLGENTCVCLCTTEVVVGYIRKIELSPTGQHVLPGSCTQKKWELDKKNPYVLNRILACAKSGTRHSHKVNYKKEGGKWKRMAQVQLTWSNLFTSLDSRLTIWPVVVLPKATLLRRSAWNREKEKIIFWHWYQATLRK